MIWVDGRVVEDDALKVSVLDRTFEHGLGLFETLRTFGGRAVLLDRHLARLRRSADQLGLQLGTVRLPDQEAVDRLGHAEGREADAVLRITVSGGLADGRQVTAWMRALPLVATDPQTGIDVEVGRWVVTEADPFARHKSLNYWARRATYERARRSGFGESLSTGSTADADPSVWEGSRTSLFIVEGETLITPTLEGPIVPGIMRQLVTDLARRAGLTVNDRGPIASSRARAADEVFLTNSVRGLIPVARWHEPETRDEPRRLPAPGPITGRISALVRNWIDDHARA